MQTISLLVSTGSEADPSGSVSLDSLVRTSRGSRREKKDDSKASFSTQDIWLYSLEIQNAVTPPSAAKIANVAATKTLVAYSQISEPP